jgi:hypothetical protein
MDQFMAGDLDAVYERLNYMDPAVRGRLGNNKWGGSADIGGSPRGGGTRLTPAEIAKAAKDALQKPKMSRQALGLLKASLLLGLVIVLAEIMHTYWHAMIAATGIMPLEVIQNPDIGYALLMLAASMTILVMPQFHRWWQFGLAIPAGKTWWWLLPVVVVCGIGGGLWLPLHWRPQWQWLEQLVCYVLLLPLATEVLFRGVLHGLLGKESRVQYGSGPWFLSWPVVGSACLYAGFIGYRLWVTFGTWEAVFTGWTAGNIFGAFAFGIAAGMVRERSHSLLPILFFHQLTVLVIMLMADFA